jgi:RNase H-fold protein (predicted Holliday junction resolvase)
VEKLNCILAIDPGREKNGVAVVTMEGTVFYQHVIATEQLLGAIEELLTDYKIDKIIIGNRTGSKEFINIMKKAGIQERVEGIIPVDEHLSTEEARQRYWQHNPPTGLKKLIPLTMQTPSVPVDDYVAVILAERYLKKCSTKK